MAKKRKPLTKLERQNLFRIIAYDKSWTKPKKKKKKK
jgi:hypothetical protein